jgi:hypothetical protein
MENLDNMVARFNQRIADRKEQDEKLGKQEPVDTGEERCSLPELTINDISARFEPKRLGDHLPIFGSPEDIIRINREHPEYLDAVRADEREGCSGQNCSRS